MRRLPIVLAASALALALGGIVQAGQASATKVAPQAKNADTIDHIHASKTPRAGSLLPLGRDARFPASVLTLTAGPKGDTGPQGAVGPQGVAGPQGTKGDTGPAGPQGVKGETGAQGPAGAQGVAGTARAYGSVVMMTASHTPVLVTHRAKDIASVGRVATGVYWVFPAQTLDARTLSPAVSVYQPEGTATAPSYAYFGGSIVHAGKTAFVVRTYALGGEAALVPSDEVSFTVLVP